MTIEQFPQNSYPSHEQDRAVEWYSPAELYRPGNLVSDLEQATIYVAGTVLHNASLPAHESQANMRQVLTYVGNQAFPQAWGLLSRLHTNSGTSQTPSLLDSLIAETCAIHTGQRILSRPANHQKPHAQPSNGSFFTQTSDYTPYSHEAPVAPANRQDLPGPLNVFEKTPEISNMLLDIFALENKCQETLRQVDNLEAIIVRLQDRVFDAVGMDFKADPDVAAVEAEVGTKNFTIERGQWQEYDEPTDRPGSRQSLQKFIDKLGERLVAGRTEELQVARLTAIDAIAQELDPDYLQQGATFVAPLPDNVPYLAAVSALTFQHARGLNAGNIFDLTKHYADRLGHIVDNNPHHLANIPDEGLVQLIPNSLTTEIKRSGPRRSIKMLTAYQTPSADDESNIHTNQAIFLNIGEGRRETDTSPKVLDGFVEPVADFTAYFETQISLGRMELCRRLGALCRDNWDETPQVADSARPELQNRYRREALEPFLAAIWRLCMLDPQDLLGKEAMGIGTPHELRVNYHRSSVFAMEAVEVEVKPELRDASQAELRVMGLDEVSLANFMHQYIKANIDPPDTVTNLAVLERYEAVLTDYLDLLSNYINSIFGSGLQPEDIIDDTTFKALMGQIDAQRSKLQ